MFSVFAGALIVAAVATAGSILSPHVPPAQRALYQFAFYIAWFLTIGAVVGASAGRMLRGLTAGLAAGLIAGLTLAVSAYVIRHFTGAPTAPGARRVLGMTLISLVWVVVWCVLAIFNARVLRPQPKGSWRGAIARGVIAALLSGVAVVILASQRPNDLRSNSTRRYIFTFVGWTLVWAPGLAALTGGTRVFKDT